MTNEAKLPWQSSTVLAGAFQILIGLGMSALGLFMPEQHGDLVLAGVTMITTGVATIKGRMAATQPVKWK
jgi:hypothetical protein